MENLLTVGLPIIAFVLPCVMIYIKLMRYIRNRPAVTGIDITQEKVGIFKNNYRNLTKCNILVSEKENQFDDCRRDNDTDSFNM